MYLDWSLVVNALDELFHNAVFWLLLTLIILDFLTGTVKAFITKDVSSSVGLNGLLKHTTILSIVAFMGVVTILSGYTEVMYLFILFYVFEYSISIMENLVRIGVPFPEKFAKLLRQWKDDNNRKWGE